MAREVITRKQKLAASKPEAPSAKKQKRQAANAAPAAAATPRKQKQPSKPAELLSSRADEVAELSLGEDSEGWATDSAEELETPAAAAAEPVATGQKRKRKGGELAAASAEPAELRSSLAEVETVPVASLRNGDASAGPGEPFRNKERVLMLTSRGIPPRHRHLMLDLQQLLPTAKKDSKLDTKSDRGVINEAAELKGCTSALFFEARKRQDCYLWAAKVPDGPTAKLLIVNVHTMAELKLSGNHLKGSRPILSFDKAFDEAPHWQLLKEMLTHVFTTPKRHHKSKPFVDHVLGFSIADGRIWLRNYQVCPALEKPKAGAEGVSLVEVGPRACLNPILIFSGAFGGPVIWENPDYVSPNAQRAAAKKQAAGKYGHKVTKRAKRRQHVQENRLPKGELDDVFK